MSQSKVKAARRAMLQKPEALGQAFVAGKGISQEVIDKTVEEVSKQAKKEDKQLPQIMSVHGLGEGVVQKPTVYWTELAMPFHNGFAHRAMIQVAMAATRPGYAYMPIPYRTTDLARNTAVSIFIQWTDDPEATLIMLDADHAHPVDVIPRLASYSKEYGVVGALAFKRDGDPLPCWFTSRDDGVLVYPTGWENLHGLVQCTIVGTGAIAIKRWVFDKLEEAGFKYPYFRIPYVETFVGRENIANPNPWPGEDVYFGLACRDAGIPHYVDIDFCTPHLVEGRSVDRAVYDRWLSTGVVTYNAPPTTDQKEKKDEVQSPSSS